VGEIINKRVEVFDYEASYQKGRNAKVFSRRNCRAGRAAEVAALLPCVRMAALKLALYSRHRLQEGPPMASYVTRG